MMSLYQNLLCGCVLVAIYMTKPASSVECPAYYTYYNVKYYHYCSVVCCDYSIPTACCVLAPYYSSSRYSRYSRFYRYSRYSGYSSWYSGYSGYSDYSSSYDIYSDDHLSGGAIVGIVIGSIVGFIVVVIVCCLCSSCSSQTTITPTTQTAVDRRSRINSISGNLVQYSGFVVEKTTVTRITVKPRTTKHM